MQEAKSRERLIGLISALVNTGSLTGLYSSKLLAMLPLHEGVESEMNCLKGVLNRDRAFGILTENVLLESVHEEGSFLC